MKHFSVYINLFFLFFSLALVAQSQNENYNLTIQVFDKNYEFPIENAQVSITPCACGGVSNRNGKLNLMLPKKTYEIRVSYIGFKTEIQNIILDQDRLVKVELVEQEQELSEVILRAKQRNENIESTQMGMFQIKAQDLKKLPTALGEFDVLKSMTLVAGVNNAGDVSNGLSVRGGSLDQNLLLFEYAPIFNPTHLFGLISIFTPEVISSVDLYRANIPARYGGRVASVLDVKVKNPYVDQFKLTGGIGILSSRLAVETPIIKDKLMLNAGFRAGFTDFLFPVFSKRLQNTKANFVDGTVKLLYLPSENDQITFTGFYSNDFYQLDLISQIQNVSSNSNQYDFSILNATLKWMHSFDEGSSLKTVFVGSNYNPNIYFPEVETDNIIDYESAIRYLSLSSEFSKKIDSEFGYSGGIQVNQYKIQPGTLDPNNAVAILPVKLNSETAYEASAYFNFDWKPTDALSLSTGFRYNYFTLVGPQTLATFDSTSGTLVRTELIEKGQPVQPYNGLEPRLGLSLAFDEKTSIKASYARINQYLQNIYNSTTPLPTSRWKVSDRNIKPQTGDTFGFGLYRNLNDNTIEMALEGYYRATNNVLTYKPGADFFLEEYIERDVVQGEGRAYGMEFSFKKPGGKVNGWVNYTWSKTLVRSINLNVAERINNNNWFPSDFDRPHVFNGTINFEGDQYNTLSINFTGQTGRPYTVPNATISLDGIDVPIFLERNNARLPVYHRMDLSWNIHFSKSKREKRLQNDWTFTIYNIYGRKNPVNIYYTQRRDFTENSTIFSNSPLGAFQLSLLNSPLFSLTYNFKFQ